MLKKIFFLLQTPEIQNSKSGPYSILKFTICPQKLFTLTMNERFNIDGGFIGKWTQFVTVLTLVMICFDSF